MLYGHLRMPSLTEQFRAAMRRVAAHTKLPMPTIREGKVNGLMYSYDEKTFVVDEAWLRRGLNKVPAAERADALVGVAAHEIVHTTEQPGFVPIEAEARADAQAGRTLREMGVPVEPFKKLIRAVHRGSPQHPPLERRLYLIG